MLINYSSFQRSDPLGFFDSGKRWEAKALQQETLTILVLSSDSLILKVTA
jgi:hypothetical protein